MVTDVVGLLVFFSVVHRIQCDVYASNSTHILRINEDTGAKEVLYPSDRSQAIGRAVGLAVDIGNNLLFWSDIDPNLQGIYKFDLTRKRVQQIYAPTGFTTEINGLSVDWIHNRVYFTDAIQRTVEVMEYDGSNRYIVAGSELQQPRGVLADPIHNKLYWNDQQTQKLETSHLDGSQRQTLLDEGLKWPNQMAFDYSLSRLYFVDGWNKTINSIASDGSDPRTDLQMTESSANPLFGLAVTRDRYFVSIWHKGVSAVNRTASSAPFTVAIGGDTVFGLATDNVRTQPSGTSVCTANPCSHLCLPASGSSYVCKCPSYSGLALSSDSRTCKVPDEFLLAAFPDAGIVGFMSEGGGALHYVGRSPRPVAVAYDRINKLVYWSDVMQANIHRAKLDGSQHEIFLNSSESIGVVDGMVFDAQNGRLYFSNMGFVVLQNVAYTWHRIEMIGRDKNGRKVVVADTERPRGLDLDEVNGYLYYTDWGTEARVVRVDLDGSNPKVMLQGLSNPNGVAVGYDGYVHVVDSNFDNASKNATLYKVSKEGQLISTNTDPKLKVPYGISYRGLDDAGTVIVSDWSTGTIIEYPTHFMIADLNGFGGIAAVLVVNNVSAAESSANNRCAVSSCDDICIPEPSGASPSYSCACDSYSADIQGILHKSSQCSVTDKFLMFADMNAIKMVSLDSMQDHTAHSVVEGNSFLSNFVGLAHDPSSNMIYFSDVNDYTIYRANVDGSNREVFYKPGQVVDGLTVADGRLFWTCAEDGLIASVALSGDNSTYQVVVSGLDRPRAIVASSGSKYLFFTEWGRVPSVSRYDLQSKLKRVLIGTQLKWPNGLHFDKRGGKLYVGDGQLRKVYTLHPDAYHVKTFGGNGNGSACVFPYEYKNKEYVACITLGHTQPWCATTDSYTRDKAWVNCIDHNVQTFGGNGTGTPCVFPFVYGGRQHFSCITMDHTQPWCATSDNYTQDRLWGNCLIDNNIQTFGGNGGGGLCVFPFLFKGQNYFTCPSVNHNQPWCSTTWNYDRDKKWGNCGINKTELNILNLPHIYDIKVLDDYLFLTSWNSSALYVVDLLTNQLRTVAPGLMRPTQMVVQFDPSTILGCPVDLQCDECKYVPGVNMMCTCEEDSHLGPDGHTCIANTTAAPTENSQPSSVYIRRMTTVESVPLTASTHSVTLSVNMPVTQSATPTTSDAYLTSQPLVSTQSTPAASQPTTLSPADSKYKPLYCPQDIHVVTSSDTRRVSFAQPDFVGDPSVTQTHKSDTDFKVGTTKVTFIALYKEKTKDGAPVRVRCSFNIIVEKKDLPCGELPVVTNGNFKCSGSKCFVECFGRYRARDPDQKYTCQKKKWTPSFGDGFGLLACYELQLPEEMTYSVQINLAGSCLKPVDEFSSDLQNEVVKLLKIKNKEFCSTEQVKSCSLNDVSVKCGRVERSARDVDGGIGINMTMVAVFLSNKHSDMSVYDRLKDFWTAHLLSYLQSLNIVVHDQRLTVSGAQAALKSILCPPALTKVGSGCAICPAATFFNKKTRECQVCPVNTYQPQPGQYKCLSCKKGSNAELGSTACITAEKTVHNDRFPTGSVVGGIFGGVACIALVVIVVLFIRHRRHYGGHLPINFNNPSYEEYENCSGTEFENPSYGLRASYCASEEKTALSSF